LKKILLVDDEDSIREIIVMMIEDYFQNEVLQAKNGQEAFELIESNSKDIGLIISDQNMPKLKGIDIYKKNKENHNIPFILLSGNDLRDIPDYIDYKETNPLNHYCPKPYEEDDLVEMIKLSLNS
jgi:YesN/AraC family two-component response regulator